jgi:hypothetical protein
LRKTRRIRRCTGGDFFRHDRRRGPRQSPVAGRSDRDSSILPSLYCTEECWQRCSPQEASNEETESYQINSDGFAAYVQPSISHGHASFAVNVTPVAPRLAPARSTHLVGVKGISFEDRGQRPQAVQVVWLSRSPIELVPVSCALGI